MNKSLQSKAIKFIVVGGISTAFNYLIFYLLIKLFAANYLIASVAGYISGLILGFFLNNFWTFRSSSYGTTKVIGYCIVYLFSLGISLLFLYVAVDQYHLNKFLMNFVAIAISTVCNFIGLNSIIYKNERRQGI